MLGNLNPDIVNAIIGATLGALLGSGSSILFGLIASRQQRKRDTVIDLYKEYNSPEVMLDRTLVSDFFRGRQPGTTYATYRDGFSDPAVAVVAGSTRQQFEAFMRLSFFFEKVYAFKENRYLNRRLASSMLGIYVCGWARSGWLEFFEESADGSDMRSLRYRAEHFRDLYQWFGCAEEERAERRQAPAG